MPMVRVTKNEGTILIEIFFDDLNEDAKKVLLDNCPFSTPEEMNWDVIPLFVVELFEREV